MDEARAVLDGLLKRAETEYVRAYVLAMLYAFLGDEASSLAWLEKTGAECDVSLPYMAADPGNFMCTGIPRKYMNPQVRADFIKRVGIIFE
jgi:hypothetical protein